MNKQPEVTLATKNRIADAFFTLYECNPINKIRIIDITKEAKCNRSTFYEYFTDIYAVLEYVEERIIQDIINLAPYADNNTYDNYLDAIIDIYTRNGRYISVLLGENGDPRFISLFKETLFQNFLSKHHLKDSMNASIIYEYSITGLIMSFRYWYLNKEQLPLEDFLKIVRNLITNGTLQSIMSAAQE